MKKVAVNGVKGCMNMCKYVKCLVVICVVCLCHCAYAVSYDTSVNLVINGDAENSTDYYNWYSSAGASIAADNGPGGAGIRCFDVPNGNDIRTVKFGITSGKYYQAKFDYKSTSGTTGWIWGFLRYWGSSEEFLGQNGFQLPVTAGSWQSIIINDSLAPEGAVTADVAFFGDGVNKDSYTGVFRFDNVQVYQEYAELLNIVPADNTTDANMYSILSWDSTGSDASYDLYLGTDVNAVAAAARTSPEYVDTIINRTARIRYAVTLRPYVQYYWRADSLAADGTAEKGRVYTFTTRFDLLENIKGATAKGYTTKDSMGYTTDGIKVIERPDDANYFGVYHSYIYKTDIAKLEFDVRLATSKKLTEWTFAQTLVVNGDMPAIMYHSPTGGYLMVHEQWGTRGSSGTAKIGFKWYASTSDLLAGVVTKSYVAPLTVGISSGLEGTPNIYSISADGNTMVIGLHYYNNTLGVDRAATGTMLNFFSASPSWTTIVETGRNNNLFSKGVNGNIGDRDYGVLFGNEYLLQEGQLIRGDWSSWRSWFWDYQRNNFYLLSPVTNNGSYSMGNMTFTYLKKCPASKPPVSPAVFGSYFIFGEGAGAGEAGPVVFYTKLQAAAWEPTPTNAQSNVQRNIQPRWLAAMGVTGHDVYFGDNAADVNNATTASGEYMGCMTKPTFDPDVLVGNTQYFWRVDEVLWDGTIFKGPLWAFTTKTAIAGDLDGNGIVNGLDLLILKSNWLNQNQPGCVGDLTNDCKVNFADFAVFAQYWTGW